MIYRKGGQSSVWVVCGEVEHAFLRKGVESSIRFEFCILMASSPDWNFVHVKIQSVFPAKSQQQGLRYPAVDLEYYLPTQDKSTCCS